MRRIRHLVNVFRLRLPARLPAWLPAHLPARIPAQLPARIPAHLPAHIRTRSFATSQSVQPSFKDVPDADGTRVDPLLEWGDTWDSNIRREGSSCKGRRHGLWTWRSSVTHQKVMEGSYVDGKKDGVWTMWDNFGTKIHEDHYKGGLLHGSSTDSVSSPFDGRLIGLMTHRAYVDGKRHGVWTYYDRWRACQVVEYKDDVMTKVISKVDIDGRETVLPEGELTVWKAGKASQNDVYIKILVPKEAGRVSSSLETRIEYGKVVSIVDLQRREYTEADRHYVVGEMVRADDFDPTSRARGRGIRVHRHREQCDQWFVHGAWTAKDGSFDGRRQGLWTEWHDGKERSVVEYKDGVVTKVISLLDAKGRETVVPDGAIHVWASARTPSVLGLGVSVRVKILVPSHVQRVSTVHHHTRIEMGYVVSIDGNGEQYTCTVDPVYPAGKLVFTVGESVSAHGFKLRWNPDPTQDCGQGIRVHRSREQC